HSTGHDDRLLCEPNVALARVRRTGLSSCCKARHDARSKRRIRFGEPRQRLFEHADEKWIDAAHDEHAPVSQAGEREEFGVVQGARHFGSLPTELTSLRIAASDTAFALCNEHTTSKRTFEWTRWNCVARTLE